MALQPEQTEFSGCSECPLRDGVKIAWLLAYGFRCFTAPSMRFSTFAQQRRAQNTQPRTDGRVRTNTASGAQREEERGGLLFQRRRQRVATDGWRRRALPPSATATGLAPVILNPMFNIEHIDRPCRWGEICAKDKQDLKYSWTGFVSGRLVFICLHMNCESLQFNKTAKSVASQQYVINCVNVGK